MVAAGQVDMALVQALPLAALWRRPFLRCKVVPALGLAAVVLQGGRYEVSSHTGTENSAGPCPFPAYSAERRTQLDS